MLPIKTDQSEKTARLRPEINRQILTEIVWETTHVDAHHLAVQLRRFPVFLSAPVTEPVDLLWRVERRRYSTHGVDYVAPRDEFSELTIPAGDTEAMLTVQTNVDHEDEPHEPLLVNLWAPPWVSRWADHPGFPTGVTMSHPENPIEGVGLILEPGSPMRDIPFVGSADHEMRQGVVRIVNRHRGVPTAVHIEAFDDLGDAPEPVTLSIGSGEARQLVSRDLERGNAIKGLSAGVGAGGATGGCGCSPMTSRLLHTCAPATGC